MPLPGEFPFPNPPEWKGRAVEALVPIVYEELRRLAQYYMRQERRDHTLQATALVHEAFLRLCGPGEHAWEDRAHFFSAAAQAMRNLLVDHARGRQRIKRGGGCEVSLDEAVTLAAPDQNDVVAVSEALDELAAMDPRQGRIVELRYFGGLSMGETASVLGISERTVRREWQTAKAWLYAHLKGAI